MTTNSKTAARMRAARHRSETMARKRAERDACAVWRPCLGCAGAVSSAKASTTVSAAGATVRHAMPVPSTYALYECRRGLSTPDTLTLTGYPP